MIYRFFFSLLLLHLPLFFREVFQRISKGVLWRQPDLTTPSLLSFEPIYTYTRYIYIHYIYTHIIYIYTHTYSIVLNFSSFFAVAHLFVGLRARLYARYPASSIDTCRSRRNIITRKQRTYETLDNETRCKAGRTLARVCVNRRRRRADWWSMRHKPEGAVLASAVKRGVRPRSSWLQESAWGVSSSSSGVANTGRQEPPNASGVFWAGWPFHSCRRTRRSLTGPKMLYIFHVDTGTTITFDIKLALQTWVSLHCCFRLFTTPVAIYARNRLGSCVMRISLICFYFVYFRVALANHR